MNIQTDSRNIKSTRPRREAIWKGLAQVSEVRGHEVLGNAAGAYVVVMCWATGRKDFRSKVATALGGLGLHLKRLEEAQIFHDSRKFKYSPVIKRMARKLKANRRLVQFGNFHTWPG